MSQANSEQLKEDLKRAIGYHQAGELTLAERAYEEILTVSPEHPDAIHLLGVIAHQLGNSELAKERINKSLEINPNQIGALSNLGNLYAEAGEWPQAIECYEKAIALKPDYQLAYLNLGDAHLVQKKYAECADYYRQAIALSADSKAYYKLANVCEEMADFDAALENFRKAIAKDSESVTAHSRLGALLRKLGRLNEAKSVYEDWLKFEPDSAIARHFLAVCGGEKLAQAAPDYIEKLFNENFAAEFDETLSDLAYRAPDLLAEAVKNHLPAVPREKLRMADLGCGTGLLAPLLRASADYLIGVDLAPAMLEMAQRREAYDELKKMDLVAFLQAHTDGFDVLVSADTLVYIGDLQPTLAAAATALREGGIFAFSLERAEDASIAEFALNPFGRYVHNQGYVEQQIEAAGLKALSLNDGTLRMEGSQPVAGMIVVAGK